MAILYITAIIFIFVIISFTWYTLEQLEIVEKVIFIAIGLMASLFVTLILFNYSSKGIEYPVYEIFTTIRSITILAIMPINAILIGVELTLLLLSNLFNSANSNIFLGVYILPQQR
jgi:hypothetical protein